MALVQILHLSRDLQRNQRGPHNYALNPATNSRQGTAHTSGASAEEEELGDGLSRPQWLRRLATIQKSAKDVLDDYASVVEFVEPAAISPTSVDPDDDAILGCALAAGADTKTPAWRLHSAPPARYSEKTAPRAPPGYTTSTRSE